MRTGPRSFVGGEVSPRLYGRPDDPRYAMGAELMENFQVTPTGVAQKRPGTEFIRHTRNDAPAVLLTYRASQFVDIWVELGVRTEYPGSSSWATYMRFHQGGATQLHSTAWDAGVTYAVGAHVTSGGSLYRCIQANSGQLPPNATYWVLANYNAGNNYDQGDLVLSGGEVYYCVQSHTSGAPVAPGTETHWYQMPSTGEYEIPTTLAINNLFNLQYDVRTSQQGSVMSFASGFGPPSDLRPISGGWVYTTVSFAPTLSPPATVTGTATKKGNAYAVGAVTSDFGNVRVTIAGEMALAPEIDVLFVEGTLLAGINNKYFRPTQVRNPAPPGTAFSFQLWDTETGLPYAYAGGALGVGGTVRVTRLNSAETNQYQVTALDVNGRESQPATSAVVTNNLNVTGAYNTVTWSEVTGATRYRIYKKSESSSLYGLIGESDTLAFRDDAIAPRLAEPPPLLDTSLDGQFLRAVTHYEGRRWWASPSDAQSQDLWGTKTNTESDLSYGIPLRDTDRIAQRIKSRLGCSILHLVPMSELIVLSDTTEFRVKSPNSDALTPESFVARAQSYVGARGVQPEIVGNVLLFAAARGGHIMQMGFSSEAGGYLTESICLRAPHLFDGHHIDQLSAQRAPMPVLWCRRRDGVLLGCTFVAGQQVLAWHRHTTDGLFESVQSGLDGSEDRTYAIVQRTVDGQTRRFVERFARSEPVQDWADSWFVDCGLRYEGAPVTTVTGLDHLEGKEVAVFADGLVQSRKVVDGGWITLDAPASKVLVGLPFAAKIRTVPAVFAVEAFGSGRRKNVSSVWVRVERSGAWSVGVDENDLLAAPVEPGDFYDGQVDVQVPGAWTEDGQLFIASADPVPCNVVGYTAEMEVAG